VLNDGERFEASPGSLGPLALFDHRFSWDREREFLLKSRDVLRRPFNQNGDAAGHVAD
jgi:hypothetical protein